MSSYVNFYIHANDGHYYPIGSYSRNTAIYEYAEGLPYGRGCAITGADISDWVDGVNAELMNEDATRRIYQERLTLIASFNNSVDEKMEAIHEVQTYLNEVDEITESLHNAKQFFLVLGTMFEEAEWSEKLNANDYIWAGVEWAPEEEE